MNEKKHKYQKLGMLLIKYLAKTEKHLGER
jgi:hypothetical protein